jgi:rRNA small subunit pseudouridine methyltransferase Nep1
LLNLVFAESALELVPREIRRMPAVVSDSRRRGKDPSEILLDRSLHHSAMNRLKDSEKRGRPDLVHEALLSVTGTPAYLEGMVRVFVHTYENVVLEIEDRTRIPKHYIRFRGLMEKVLVERPSEGLVKFRPGGMRELGRKVIDPDLVVGLSVQGKPKRLEEVAVEVRASKRPCVLIGGFPHGHFSSGTLGLVNELLRIDSRPLEAHVVAARLVYEVEKAEKQFND